MGEKSSKGTINPKTNKTNKHDTGDADTVLIHVKRTLLIHLEAHPLDYLHPDNLLRIRQSN